MATTNQTNKAQPAGARMRAEVKLKAVTEDLKRRVAKHTDELQVAGVGTWDWDLLKNTLICCEQYVRLCGLEPIESTVKTFEEWKSCIHPRDRDRAADKALAALETDEPYEDEYRVVWPDGTIHWLAYQGRMLRDETGKPARMLGVNVDITDRKQAEGDYRRLATIVVDSNDAVTIQDFEGRLTAWNRGAEQMYGYSEAEALTMNIRDIVPEDRCDQALDYLERIARGDNVQSLETQRSTKDGRTLDVWLTVTKLVDDDGMPVGVATTERDITERKQLEQRFAELTDQERQRIGRELHDTTGQELTGLGFIAQSLLEQLAAESHPAEETVRKMEEGIQRALAQVRRFAQGLVPVELDARGLMAALQRAGHGYDRRPQHPLQVPQ